MLIVDLSLASVQCGRMRMRMTTITLQCSIWTNTTDLFVVPRLSSLVLGSFYRRTFPLFSLE